MSKKSQQDRRTVLGLSGALSTNWAMLGQAVVEKGGAPEDLGVLGEPENPATIELVDAMATRLVAIGNKARVTREKAALIPPQLAFKCALQPRHLFILNKSGADAATLLSRMDGTYLVTDYAKGMMSASEFVIGPAETALIGVFTCDQLGATNLPETDFFGPKGWEHVKQFGLTKCLPDDGPYIRQAHSKQALGEWFRVAHDPIPSDGYYCVWDVGHDSGSRRYLNGWRLNPDYRLNAISLVALRLAS